MYLDSSFRVKYSSFSGLFFGRDGRYWSNCCSVKQHIKKRIHFEKTLNIFKFNRSFFNNSSVFCMLKLSPKRSPFGQGTLSIPN